MKQFFTNALFISFLSLLSTAAFSQNTKEDSLKRIATKNTVDTTVIDANKQLGILLQEDKPDEAIQYGLVALSKSKILNDKFRVGQSNMNIGVAYDYKGSLDSCLYYLNEALTIFKTINRLDFQANAISNKALAYYYRGNFQLALQYHLEALE